MTDLAVNYSVPLVPQPTAVSCWAAALTMVVSNRDSASYAPESIAEAAKMDLNTGYGWSDISNAVSAWNLSTEGPVSALPSYWAGLLASSGPLWIVEVGAPYHAVVVVGINGDGTPEGTTVTVNNPWPPNSGAVETKSFTAFDTEFGLGAGASAQIVHQ
jgi:hypothetical protein